MTSCDCKTSKTRTLQGRRDDDYRRNIEIHPVALSVMAGVFTILLSIAGYFFKGWADNITYEIRQARVATEKQLSETGANNEWKNDMSRWRGDVDNQLKEIDTKMYSTPWYSPRKHSLSASFHGQTIGGVK